MTTNRINSMKKVRALLDTETDLDILAAYYHIVETLLFHYKRILSKSKEMEAIQLLKKIKLIMIKKITVS